MTIMPSGAQAGIIPDFGIGSNSVRNIKDHIHLRDQTEQDFLSVHRSHLDMKQRYDQKPNDPSNKHLQQLGKLYF
ncbi:hypothetical protein BpHYR1_048595 [Brachionus plicatilis]|uniref:Uncharacterized protein n=1 Tax=Brachionus plicatilis TaxID=10195 RepID=A0A3M7QQF9_BRAPC|nr:hypothetical protein BpHYR1_048595 [Brachionus plicatilis]